MYYINIGAISNTASYLRLWALSLAHGQLAKVFFEKCLGGGIEEGNFFFLFIGWPVFMHCTVFGIFFNINSFIMYGSYGMFLTCVTFIMG